MTIAKRSRQSNKLARQLAKKQQSGWLQPSLIGAIMPRSALAALLILCTFVVYSPVLSYPFVNYDDGDYVTRNLHVQQGLTKATFAWAITSTEYSNWHPVTWFSHALDWELFGGNARGHHFTSILLHALNAVLLFLLLAWVTGKTGRSLFVGALFALHPLNVESVAWVAERKTVLSMFFFLLTLAAYAWYARQPKFWRYVCVFALFALGLAAKPMIVTLPFLLMLLVYWPLQRIASWTPQPEVLIVPQRPWRWLAWEKLPLLVLSAASCVLTVLAQRGSIPASDVLPIGLRLANAIHSYVMYLSKTFWPHPLGVYYPLDPSTVTTLETVLSFLLVGGLSIGAWRLRARGHLFMGWFWFLGALIPMIGVVQVGNQAMADRYAYLPLIGIFIALAWESEDLVVRRGVDLKWSVAAGCIVLVSLSLVTLQQIKVWSSSSALWTHTLEITKHNIVAERSLYLAEDNLAYELLSLGRQDEALEHFQNAARLSPADPLSHWALAAHLDDQGRLAEAMQNYEVVASNSKNPRQLTAAYLSLAVIASELGQYAKASEYSQKALQTDPQTVDALVLDAERTAATNTSASAYLRLGLLLEQARQTSKARQAYEQAIKLDPGSPLGHQLLNHLQAARPGS